MMHLTLALVLVATAVTGLLAGASLDQSVKQLPARRRIGVLAYANYSQAADLKNGVPFYAVLGVGTLFLSVAAAIAIRCAGLVQSDRTPTDISAVLAVLHSSVSGVAAPLNHAQRRIGDDVPALVQLFNRFARWQGLRAGLQLANFGVLLWATVNVARAE